MMGERFLSILLIDIGGDQHTSEIPLRLRDEFASAKIGAITSTKNGFKNNFDYLFSYNDIVSEKCLHETFFYGIGTDLYALVKNCEIDALKMMDRLPRFQHGYRGDLTERRALFFQLSKFLHKLVIDNQITHVVFSNIPHEVYDFILYSLCKSLNIPTLLFNDAGGVIKHSMIISESIEDLGRLDFGAHIKNVVESVQTNNWEFDVEQSFKRSDFLAKPITARQSFQIRQKIANVPYTKRRFQRYLSQREYRKHLQSDSLPSRYLLFALHVQPELSTSPCGGHFVEQIEAIRLLAKASEGCQILVREHPDQFRLRIPRPKGFYKSISKIPGVVFSPSTINVHDAITKASAVATVSGTIALEAVLLGRPGLIFGFSWFRECPGIISVSDQTAMDHSMKTLHDWKPPNQILLEMYLEKLKGSLFQGTTWGSPYDISSNENLALRNITVSNMTNIIQHWVLKN